MNNKGEITSNVILVLILAAGLMFIVLLFFMLSLIGPPSLGLSLEFIDGAQELFKGVELNPSENLSSIADPHIEHARSFTNVFRWFSYILFVVMFTAFLIFAYFTRTYPFLAFIWIFLIIFLVIASIWMTNFYIDFANTEGFGDYYDAWPESDFLIRYLPHIMGVMGFFMGIILFVVATRDRETEEVGII